MSKANHLLAGQDANLNFVFTSSSVCTKSICANSNSTTIQPGVVNTTKLGGDITPQGKAILDDATATQQRSTIGATTYTHTQSVAANPWVINHNLNAYPTVWVIDQILNRAGWAEVEYPSANTVNVHFPGACTGIAYLNF